MYFLISVLVQINSSEFCLSVYPDHFFFRYPLRDAGRTKIRNSSRSSIFFSSDRTRNPPTPLQLRLFFNFKTRVRIYDGSRNVRPVTFTRRRTTNMPAAVAPRGNFSKANPKKFKSIHFPQKGRVYLPRRSSIKLCTRQTAKFIVSTRECAMIDVCLNFDINLIIVIIIIITASASLHRVTLVIR